MDLAKVLAHLRSELANLNLAIESLERIQKETKRRGRPPKALSSTQKAAGGGEGENPASKKK